MNLRELKPGLLISSPDFDDHPLFGHCVALVWREEDKACLLFVNKMHPNILASGYNPDNGLPDGAYHASFVYLARPQICRPHIENTDMCLFFEDDFPNIPKSAEKILLPPPISISLDALELLLQQNYLEYAPLDYQIIFNLPIEKRYEAACALLGKSREDIFRQPGHA